MAHLDGETNTNLIYFVSDGIETCGGDPVRAAKEIAESNIQPVVHIIGFDVPSDEQQQLKDMAGAANGMDSSCCPRWPSGCHRFNWCWSSFKVRKCRS